MKKLFKAAVLFEQHKPLRIINLDYPYKLDQGQVLVKIISFAICGAQLGEIDGIKGNDKWLPHCMGHEGYGIVVGKHFSVKKLKINDEVVMHWKSGKGTNSNGFRYISKFGDINSGQVTTFQEYSVASENRLTRVKNLKKFKNIAPLLGCAIPTSWGLLTKEMNFNKNDKILILGAGGIGIITAIISRILGCKNIFLYDKFNKKKIIKKIKLNFLSKNSLNLPATFNKVIDTTGVPKLISKGFDLLDKNGFLMLVGQPKKGSKLTLNDPINLFNSPNKHVKIISSDGGNFNPDKDMTKIIYLLKKNHIIFNSIISKYFGINKINKAIINLRRGKAVRSVILN
jgi:Zn-dependent alcohol dehydrogenase